MRRNRRQSGNTLFSVLVVVLVVGALGAAVLSAQLGSSAQAGSRVAVERAYQMAEAGVAWAVADLRTRSGVLPTDPLVVRRPHPTGRYLVRTESAASNGQDDDGDGVVDDADEADLSVILATGEAGGVQRTLEVVLRVEVEAPELVSALSLNDATPLLDFDGNAFRINGNDHAIDGSDNPAGTDRAGISTVGATADVEIQLAANQYDQVIGTGGEPSITQDASVDLDALIEFASVVPTITLEPGTHSGVELGEATADGVEVVYAPGDLTLSGGTTGAGVLAVDGDLHISGGLQWTGIVLVRGRVEFTGGGGTNKVVGAFVVGEGMTVGGTVDLLYSSEAIDLVKLQLTYLGIYSRREVGNP